MTTNNAVNVGLSGATGTGNFVGANTPTLITPHLGTPIDGTLTTCTGYTIANLADVAWTDFSGTIGYTGFTGSVTTTLALYKKIGKTVFINIQCSGTSNATSFTITGLPFAAQHSTTYTSFLLGTDNGANVACVGSITSTTITLYNGVTATTWTNSGSKGLSSEFFYETT